MINRVAVIIALPLTKINKNKTCIFLHAIQRAVVDVSSMASLTFFLLLASCASSRCRDNSHDHINGLFTSQQLPVQKKTWGFRDSKQSPGKRHHSTAIHLPDCGKLLLDLRQPVLQLSMGDPLNDGHGHHFSGHTAIMAAEHLGHTRFLS